MESQPNPPNVPFLIKRTHANLCVMGKLKNPESHQKYPSPLVGSGNPIREPWIISPKKQTSLFWSTGLPERKVVSKKITTHPEKKHTLDVLPLVASYESGIPLKKPVGKGCSGCVPNGVVKQFRLLG